MSRKHSGKFYYKNEKKVMEQLGFKPTPGSGSGWILKEDGQTEHSIAQLKSTDSESMRVSLLDIQKLESNATIAHKKPVFVIQFLKTNDIFILIRPDKEVLDLIHKELPYEKLEVAESKTKKTKTIKSKPENRKIFYDKREATQNVKNETYSKVRRAYSKEKPIRQLEPELPI